MAFPPKVEFRRDGQPSRFLLRVNYSLEMSPSDAGFWFRDEVRVFRFSDGKDDLSAVSTISVGPWHFNPDESSGLMINRSTPEIVVAALSDWLVAEDRLFLERDLIARPREAFVATVLVAPILPIPLCARSKPTRPEDALT